jgi:hypothetical protein
MRALIQNSSWLINEFPSPETTPITHIKPIGESERHALPEHDHPINSPHQAWINLAVLLQNILDAASYLRRLPFGSLRYSSRSKHGATITPAPINACLLA